MGIFDDVTRSCDDVNDFNVDGIMVIDDVCVGNVVENVGNDVTFWWWIEVAEFEEFAIFYLEIWLISIATLRLALILLDNSVLLWGISISEGSEAKVDKYSEKWKNEIAQIAITENQNNKTLSVRNSVILLVIRIIGSYFGKSRLKAEFEISPRIFRSLFKKRSCN